MTDKVHHQTRKSADISLAKRQISPASHRAVLAGAISLQHARDLGRDRGPTDTAQASGGQEEARTGPRKGRTPRPCMCSCGGTTKGGRFLPGHDARLHSELKRNLKNDPLLKNERFTDEQTAYARERGLIWVAKDRTKANGEGTIYKRGKGYCGQYHMVTRDGTKKRRSVYGKTRAEAAEKLAAAIADRDRGLSFDAGTLTLGEHLDRYLEDAKGRLRPKPFNRAEGLVRNHLKPTLGSVKLKDLSPAHLRGLYAAKLDYGLSGRTVGYIHVTLYGALKQAVTDGLIPRNPAEGVKPPRASSRRGRQAAEGGQEQDDPPLPRPGKDAA